MRVIIILSIIFFVSYSLCSDFKTRANVKKNIYPNVKRVDGEWIIKFTKEAPKEVIDRVIAKFKDEGVYIKYWSEDNTKGHLFGLTGIDEEQCDLIIDEFFDYVEYSEPNIIVGLDINHINGNDANINAVQPNVTSWGLDRIDQRNLPLDELYHYNFTGKDVNVYIVDSGIRSSHVEFEGRASSIYSAYGDDGSDCNGHGTHVSGIVASKTYGVAKDAKIHSLKVLGCDGRGSALDILDAFEYINSNLKKPAVIQMSIGFDGRVQYIEDIIKDLRKKGVLTVLAAGNSAMDACYTSPAGAGDSLVVGSSTPSDTISSFSNFGSCVDIFAPGSDILSTIHTSDSGSQLMSGTSMAAPFVSGVAALHLQKEPQISPDSLQKKIVNSATSISKLNNGETGKLLYTNSIEGLNSVFLMKNSLYIIIPMILMMLI